MDAPHRSTLPPKEPDQAPPTMEDLCAEKDFFDWIVAIADLQALTAKEVTGVLQPSEFATIWNTRLQALKKLPRLLLGLQTLAQNKEGRDLSWRVITSGTLEIHAEGHLTMATVDRDGKKTIHPKLTTWLGGVHSIIKHGVPIILFQGSRIATSQEFQLFATTFQTIYETAAKKAHQPSRVYILSGQGEKGGSPGFPTVKITHCESLGAKTAVVAQATGNRGAGGRERPRWGPYQNQGDGGGAHRQDRGDHRGYRQWNH